MGCFKADLKSGEEIESEILEVLKKKFPHAYKEAGKYCREYYDIIIPKLEKQPEIRIEIKADLYVSSNFAIECLGRGGKPTGLIKTSSHFWIQFRKSKYYVWKTAGLRQYMLNVGGLLKSCGDGHASSAWIIPEERLLRDCPPLAVLNRRDQALCNIIC